MEAVEMKFARVIIPSPVKEPLVYAVPEGLRRTLTAGMRVIVPLGRRRVRGITYELLPTTSVPDTREILAIEDERVLLDEGLMRLCQWMAQYYVSSLGDVLATVLPPRARQGAERVVIARRGHFAVDDRLEREILESLAGKTAAVSVKSLTRKLGPEVHKALERLASRGALVIRERLPGSRKGGSFTSFHRDEGAAPQAAAPALTDEQRAVLTPIEQRIEQSGFEPFLLHGVTGSGKTEVYLQAMERTRQRGRSSLILIPEISLTPQLIDRLKARFPGKVGVLHSGLTGAERWDQWRQIARGGVDIIVGARSAVFAPAPNLGLIVVDEEHDTSYKQEEGLRYNGRDLAVVRGKLLGCPVVLGSATPAVESYQNAVRGRYRLLTMTRRVEQRPLPRIEIVDLREEIRAAEYTDPQKRPVKRQAEKSFTLLSRRLTDSLQANFRARRQSLIFLNRRGFSNFLQCRICGYVLRCSYCSVTLTLHLRERILSCHHCNFGRKATELCPACGNSSLAGVGAGTEQIEQHLTELLPQARIARMDRDTTTRRGAQEELIRAWERGVIDVLVGTQMITKGHDVAGVTLVGALLADASLNLPDFRAAERTFQILSQVAGRSGRGAHPGTVIVQTYAPDHYAIEHLTRHDYCAFFAAELEFRRALNYPPFGRLIHLRIEGPDGEKVEQQARALAQTLREHSGNGSAMAAKIEVLGPAPAPIFRRRNRYRWQVLLKGKEISALQRLAIIAREWLPRGRAVRLHIDVDPFSML